MILYIACIVLALYSAGLTIAVVYRLAKARKVMAGMFDELLDEGEVHPPFPTEGFIASGMTIDTEPFVDTRTDEEKRREYREQIEFSYERALHDLDDAERYGRRTDCLRQAVEGYHGALRNVCAEDGVTLDGEPIVETPSDAGAQKFGAGGKPHGKMAAKRKAQRAARKRQRR